MAKTISLLRYPGGKAKLYDFVKKLIQNYSLNNKTYVEPFSGGFGLGLKLLINKDVSRVILNDFDIHIYSFWKCAFYDTFNLINKIKTTHINVDEWRKQKEIYNNYNKYNVLEIGFSTLFLNRTNYSGILKGGPIGGFDQQGKYKIDCRFNKERIITYLLELSKLKNYVEVYNLDAITLIHYLKNRENELFYNFDPPYVKKGQELYLNAFKLQDHINLKNEVHNIKTNWIMTYDNEEFIEQLYNEFYLSSQILTYSVKTKRKVKELFISNFFNPKDIEG